MKTKSKVDEMFRKIEETLTSHRHSENARGMKAYMKNRFEFLGIKAPLRKEILKSIYAETKKLEETEVIALVEKCWKAGYREFQYAGMIILQKNLKRLGEFSFQAIESFILTKSWWDTVDFLASNLVGPLFNKFPKQRNELVGKWRIHHDIWLRRTCLLFQLKYKSGTDFDLLRSLILENMDDKEFFIQKAIGWALREYSKYEKEPVRQFIDSHPELSNLATREGRRYV